jgi:glycolate oxidase FAD binding subunit
MIATDLMTSLQSIISEAQMEESTMDDSLLGNNGQLVVYPKTEQEIASILEYANGLGKKVNIVGSGTKRGFGGLEESAEILLSLAKYKGIIEHSVGDMTLIVKSGTTFKELQDYLAQFNQKIPLDPSWPSYATIGGVIAANDSGPKRLGYGSARDLVIGLKIVYPDGTVIRTGGKTVKNVAGYDMNKLFIGSMGTLGLISEVTLKLRPKPRYESLVLLSLPTGNPDEISSFAVRFLDSVMEPIAMELLGPTLSERLTGRHSYTLAISFEDVENSVRYEVGFVKENQPLDSEISVLEQNEAQAFWNSLNKISPNGAIPETGTEIRAALKIGVKNLDVIKVIKESEQIQATHHVAVEAHGGMGNGLCTVILSGSRQDIAGAINELRAFVQHLGGYVIAKHLPLELRGQIEVWGEKPPYFFLLEGIKIKVDPNRILNHKRFVGGI